MSALNPKKLRLTKWTAAHPADQEKHFLVVRVLNHEAPRHGITEVAMEAVMTKRQFVVRRRDLEDASRWLPGWR